MGRPKRIEFAGACYYVVLRGNNRQDVFLSNQDRRHFLSLLRANKERYGLKIYAYCLVPHEIHLLIETLSPNLSRLMQSLNTAYTKYFNGCHNTLGHLFIGRYRAFLVEKESHLSKIAGHVHLEPVRAGLKEKPWRYPWSSCSAYVESETKEPWIDSEEILRPLAKSRLKQSVFYLQDLKSRMRAAQTPLSAVGDIIGSEEFVAKHLAEVSGAHLNPADKAEIKGKREVEIRKVLAELASRSGIKAETILGPVRFREVSALRRQAVCRIWKGTGMSMTELALLFGRTTSAMSQMIRSVELPEIGTVPISLGLKA